MKEKIILCISIVRDMEDNNILVLQDPRSTLEHYNPKHILPKGIKKADEDPCQCVIRITKEATGVTVKNPEEVATIKLEMGDEIYTVLVFISTDYSGGLDAAPGTEAFWLNVTEVELEGDIAYRIMPYILNGKYVVGSYIISPDNFQLRSMRDL